jgi:hypothetical protein
MNQNETASVPAIEEQEPIQTREWRIKGNLVVAPDRTRFVMSGAAIDRELIVLKINESIQLAKQAPPSATIKDKSLAEKEPLAKNTHVLQNALLEASDDIVDAILFDLRGRQGIGNEISLIEEDIYNEMRGELIDLTDKVLLSEHATKSADASGFPKPSPTSASEEANERGVESQLSGLRMYHKWAESELLLQARTIKRLEEKDAQRATTQAEGGEQ